MTGYGLYRGSTRPKAGFQTASYKVTLRIGAESGGVGASLVGAQATQRIQLAESYEGNHKGCPYNA